MPKGRQIVDLTGQRFGRLVALSIAGRKRYGSSSKILWLCRCDCGQDHVAKSNQLRLGRTRSCGCLQREVTITRNKTEMVTHGMTASRDFRCWASMISRCTNPKTPEYRYYGARGIKVCERWRAFENFYADMGPRPRGLSIERIDTNGDYEPGNCRWATAKEQANNRRNNAIVEYAGRRQNVTQWAEEFGIDPERLRDYLRRKSMAQALMELTA